MEPDAMIVVASPEQAEALLDARQLRCPGCPGALRPHGYGRIRRVRSLGEAPVTERPRRARCPECAATHMLLPAALVLRRADTAQVIGTALASQARGDGPRRIAAQLGRPVSTVRRWLRRAREPHADCLQEQGVQHAYRADPDILNRDLVWPTPLGDARNPLSPARRWPTSSVGIPRCQCGR
jgi:hypothetical protein